MQRTVDELCRIAGLGGGFAVDARKYAVEELTRIAGFANGTGGRIHVANAGGLTTEQVCKIASSGGGCVSFELF